MRTQAIAKPARMIIAAILAAILLSVSLPFTAMATIDTLFTDGSLMYIVTSEGDDSEPGTVSVMFNEDVDPDTVTGITIPGIVNNEGSSYVVSSIPESAFSCCAKLAALDMSACTGLKSIGAESFIGCESLKSIAIPCNFDKALFKDSGIVPDGEGFKIEYTAMSAGEVITPVTITVATGGTFTYVHDWKPNDKNFSEHKCANCSTKALHSWQPDEKNASRHICTVCGYTEEHYGGTANCKTKIAKCIVCGTEYKSSAPGVHSWGVIPETIGATTAQYECASCQNVEVQSFSANDNTVNFNGQKLNTILQDPYKVLNNGTTLKTTVVEPGTTRYNELFSFLDDSARFDNKAFFELDLYSAKDERITGEIAGKVRILIQIPDGWDKKNLEAVLIMDGQDIEFEESIITIDGIDYLAFWTNHFSPYALISVKAENNGVSKDTGNKSPVMGSPEYSVFSLLALAALPASMIAYTVYKKKKRMN